MSAKLTKSVVAQSTVAWLERLGWLVTHGLETAPGEAGAERTGDGFVVPVLVKDSPESFRAASRRKTEN